VSADKGFALAALRRRRHQYAAANAAKVQRKSQTDAASADWHSAGQIESNYDETTDSFDNMNLKAELLRGVYAYGFERPSAIQQRAIMPVIKGESAPHHAHRNLGG
jgi:superfamily II DNA/RNA helicase